jgi:hypothetical protein
MSLLTDDEVNAVIEAALRGSGPLPEFRLQGVVDWARLVKLQGEVLTLVLQGRVVIDVTTGPEPLFRLAEDSLKKDRF